MMHRNKADRTRPLRENASPGTGQAGRTVDLAIATVGTCWRRLKGR